MDLTQHDIQRESNYWQGGTLVYSEMSLTEEWQGGEVKGSVTETCTRREGGKGNLMEFYLEEMSPLRKNCLGFVPEKRGLNR